jgi:hypothetical protein
MFSVRTRENCVRLRRHTFRYSYLPIMRKVECSDCMYGESERCEREGRLNIAGLDFLKGSCRNLILYGEFCVQLEIPNSLVWKLNFNLNLERKISPVFGPNNFALFRYTDGVGVP